MRVPFLTGPVSAPTTSTPSRSNTPVPPNPRRRHVHSRHNSVTGPREMDQPMVDPDASAIGADDRSRIITSQSEAGDPSVHAGRNRNPLPPPTPQSSLSAADGRNSRSSDDDEEMQIEGEFYAASAIAASDISRLRVTETVRPPRSVVSSVPPAMQVDPISRAVIRTEASAPTQPFPMGPPPEAEQAELADFEWDDPLHDDDLLQAQAAADARGVGERAEAYPWPVEHHVINWSAYMHNTQRVLEKFPEYPSVPSHVYKQSWKWAQDRKRALQAPREIVGCHRDKNHMHGQAVHAWQMKGAVPRRNLFAKIYLPALLDHTEFGDRVIGSFVQATFVAKIDDGPDRPPVVQAHFTRLIQNNEGMKRIGNQMAIAFKRGIADIAHDNLTNYKRLEEVNEERKALRKTPLENLTEPPIIPMREFMNHANAQEVRETSLVPPDIAVRVGVKAYRRLDDPDLYTVGPAPATTSAGPHQAHDHEPVHEPVRVHVPSPSTPVTRVFEEEPPEDSPYDVGRDLQTAMVAFFEEQNLKPPSSREALARRQGPDGPALSTFLPLEPPTPMSAMSINNTLLASSDTILAVGRPIDTALKSMTSTFTILTHESPVITAAIKTLSDIHDLERENELLQQYHTFAKHDQDGEFDPLVARTEHMRQELVDVEERKAFYLPPFDTTWAKVNKARQLYTTLHASNDSVNITPGGAVLLQYALRIFAVQMDTLRSQLAAGSDVQALHHRLDEVKQENENLRAALAVDDALYNRVHAVMEAERALRVAKQELEELQQAHDARLSELAVYTA
ncbi:hypothetical protein CALCODRAFT_484809 [Calocera cornea HHB12733]|uniref:Uncharacterized protein n=1 Tax=Calocera cornea HHB12733 TaxID=1353952 RepID=A0A165ESD6_9BASI|nr:hypothetical protein CALCODRAFT_484809 [Calocera cornea HHB12733]